jgi:hypothetical protein
MACLAQSGSERRPRRVTHSCRTCSSSGTRGCGWRSRLAQPLANPWPLRCRCCRPQVLATYTTLPLNYICRILAQGGLVPRLFKLLKESLAHKRKKPGPAAAAVATPRPDAAASPRGNGAAAGSATATPRDGRVASSAPAPAAPRAHTLPLLHGSSAPAAAAALGLLEVGGAAPPPAAAGSRQQQQGLMPGPLLTADDVDFLLDKCVCLLSVLSNADDVVKAAMATRDNLLNHMDCLGRLPMPHVVEVRVP